MIPFEFSMTNLVITAAILILAALYIVILLKLKPSTKNKDQHKKDVLPEKREPPPQNGLIFVNSLKTKEKATPPQGAQTQVNSQKIEHPLAKTSATRPSAPEDRNQEAPKHVVKQETRPSNLHCAHHFGYLRTLPKNTPIPSECLGCRQVVDCMTTLKVGRKLVRGYVIKS